MAKKRPLPCYDIEKTASVTEMTGLIPFALENDYQAESYEALYPIHRQQTDNDSPDPDDLPGVCPNPAGTRSSLHERKPTPRPPKT